LLSPIRIAGNEYGQFGEEAEAESTVVLNVIGPEPDEDACSFSIGLRNVANLAVALWDVSLVDANSVNYAESTNLGTTGQAHGIIMCRPRSSPKPFSEFAVHRGMYGKISRSFLDLLYRPRRGRRWPVRRDSATLR
jgi:hypothetical protein